MLLDRSSARIVPVRAAGPSGAAPPHSARRRQRVGQAGADLSLGRAQVAMRLWFLVNAHRRALHWFTYMTFSRPSSFPRN
jgi:hypothetical protein